MDTQTPQARKLKLHQAVAAEKGIKTSAYALLTKLYQTAQKAELFSGLHNVYNPKTEDGEKLPPERKAIEQTVEDCLRQARLALIEPYDMTATVARGNMTATADLEVDGVLLLRDQPVQFYLFVEKQLADVKSFIDALPTLDPGEVWGRYDANTGCYRSEPTEAVRTKKVPRPIVKVEATREHPAQTELVNEDHPVGTWVKTKMSAALPVTVKREMQRRINTLIVAVKQAREQANATEVEKQRVGATILDYLFDPVLGAQAQRDK